jgi:HEAT repeat protein
VASLQSTNTDEVRTAIDLLTVLDGPEVVAPIAELLRSGQPDVVTDRAIEALGQIAEPGGIDVLVEMTRHRREGARRRAYQALAQIRDPRVPRLVEQGLRDSDRNVRGTAALALGELGARDSVDLLFHAFERGVIEAAVAIGKLGDARAARRFSELLGRHPLSVMLSGFEQFVRRRDLADDVKLEIVGKLGEVSGPMVKQFLREYLSTFAERDRSALKRAVEETIRRIPDAPRTTASPASLTAAGGGAGGAS